MAGLDIGMTLEGVVSAAMIVSDWAIYMEKIPGGHRLTARRGTEVQSMDIMDGVGEGGSGKDGVSPIVTVTPIEGGNRLSVTDAEGTKSIDIMNGEKGEPGKDAPQESVLYTAQSLTEAQKNQARENIGAAAADRVEKLSKGIAEQGKAIEGKQPKGDYALKSEIPAPYTLPTASDTVKGGVKVGEGLRIDGDVLEVVSEGVYELIEAITIDTDTTIVSRTQTPSGEDYCYKDVMVNIIYASEHERNMWARMKIWFDNNATLDAFRANDNGTLIGEQVMQTNRYRNFVTVRISGITTNKGHIVPENSLMVSNAFVYNSGNINRIDIDRQDGFFPGDILRIYAVKE